MTISCFSAMPKALAQVCLNVCRRLVAAAFWALAIGFGEKVILGNSLKKHQQKIADAFQ